MSFLNSAGLFDVIPDEEIYLHDDWEDNKLTNRDDGGTVTYNGVTGVYRPDWSTISGESTPSVTNGELVLTGGDAIVTGINLPDLTNYTITWEYTIDRSNSGTGAADQANVHLFAEQNSSLTNRKLHSSYVMTHRGSQDEDRLQEIDGSGTGSDLIIASNPSDIVSYRITRSPSGEWEIYQNDVSQGTATDTSHTNPTDVGLTGRDNGDYRVGQYKVS